MEVGVALTRPLSRCDLAGRSAPSHLRVDVLRTNGSLSDPGLQLGVTGSTEAVTPRRIVERGSPGASSDLFGTRSFIAKLRGVTQCLFCGEPGATREHVLSLAWLSQLMPSAGPYKFDRTTEEQGVIKRQRYEKRKPEVVRRAVCATCNSGWMNRLDQSAQPMLTAMIKGTSISIADVGMPKTLSSRVSSVKKSPGRISSSVARASD